MFMNFWISSCILTFMLVCMYIFSASFVFPKICDSWHPKTSLKIAVFITAKSNFNTMNIKGSVKQLNLTISRRGKILLLFFRFMLGSIEKYLYLSYPRRKGLLWIVFRSWVELCPIRKLSFLSPKKYRLKWQ